MGSAFKTSHALSQIARSAPSFLHQPSRIRSSIDMTPLPAGDRAGQPLLRGYSAATVRRCYPRRPNTALIPLETSVPWRQGEEYPETLTSAFNLAGLFELQGVVLFTPTKQPDHHPPRQFSRSGKRLRSDIIKAHPRGELAEWLKAAVC
jgi:hypothetical protein